MKSVRSNSTSYELTMAKRGTDDREKASLKSIEFQTTIRATRILGNQPNKV